MFEGEERWSRNCGSGIGLSNYKNVFRDDILVGNWQEDLYGNRINPDNSSAVSASCTTCSTTVDPLSGCMFVLSRSLFCGDLAVVLRCGGQEQQSGHYLSVTMNDFDRKGMDPDRQRGTTTSYRCLTIKQP